MVLIGPVGLLRVQGSSTVGSDGGRERTEGEPTKVDGRWTTDRKETERGVRANRNVHFARLEGLLCKVAGYIALSCKHALTASSCRRRPSSPPFPPLRVRFESAAPVNHDCFRALRPRPTGLGIRDVATSFFHLHIFADAQTMLDRGAIAAKHRPRRKQGA